MTPAQITLARWLASSPVLREWGAEEQWPSIPSVCVKHCGDVVASAHSARGTGYYFSCGWLPDITSPLMVGPLTEMLLGAEGWVTVEALDASVAGDHAADGDDGARVARASLLGRRYRRVHRRGGEDAPGRTLCGGVAVTLPDGWQPVHNARVRNSTPWPGVAERFEPDVRVIAVYGGYRWSPAPYTEVCGEIYASIEDAARAAER